MASGWGARFSTSTPRNACWHAHSQVFAEFGEPAFREAEQDALSDALRPIEPIVLATGRHLVRTAME